VIFCFLEQSVSGTLRWSARKKSYQRINCADDEKVENKVYERIARRMRPAVDIEKDVDGIDNSSKQDNPAGDCYRDKKGDLPLKPVYVHISSFLN